MGSILQRMELFFSILPTAFMNSLQQEIKYFLSGEDVLRYTSWENDSVPILL